MDTLTPEARSENMRRITSKNTKPEITVRKLIFKMGFRYRIHYPNLPGKPDIVLPKYRKVLLINGCFWHQHKACKHGRVPKSNRNFWIDKFARNRLRDAINIRSMRSDGWKVTIIWECETNDMGKLEEKLKNFLA